MRWKVLIALMVLGSAALRAETPVPARAEDTKEVMHGVEVADPYRWMENLESPELAGWIKQENARTQAFADKLPVADHYQRLREIQDYSLLLAPQRRGDKLYYVEFQIFGGTAGNIRYYVQRDGNSELTLVADASTIDPSGKYRLQRFSSLSPDGRYWAFTYAAPASRWLRLRVLDLKEKKLLADELSGLHVFSGQVAWMPDGSGFYYGRYKAPAEADEMKTQVGEAKIYFHRVNTPQSEDALIYENPAEADWIYAPLVSTDGNRLLLRGSRGASRDVTLLVGETCQEPVKFTNATAGRPGQFTYIGDQGSTLYFVSDHKSPRGSIVGVETRDLARPEWKTVIPEGEEAIIHARFAAGHFILFFNQDAAPQIATVKRDGTGRRSVKLPHNGTVWGPPWGAGFMGRADDQYAFFNLASASDPGSIYRLDPAKGKVELWRRPKLNFDPEGFEIEQVFFKSKDGTRVPLFLAHKRGVKPVKAPTFLYAYGGLNWSAFPFFSPHLLAFMEKGGTFAVASIRGGGEYGESWHQAGIKTNRHKAIEDYLSAAEYLIQKGYTDSDHLIANSGSLGGPLPLVAMIREPQLFAGVISDFPVIDLLRYQKHTGGLAWVGELGSVEDAAEFQSLLNYSPYHNLKDGACYPPTLVMAGSKDQVAVPSHAYKFVARMQEAQRCENPVLLQWVEGAGHTFGATPEQAARTWSLQLAFMDQVVNQRQKRR